MRLPRPPRGRMRSPARRRARRAASRAVGVELGRAGAGRRRRGRSTSLTSSRPPPSGRSPGRRPSASAAAPAGASRRRTRRHAHGAVANLHPRPPAMSTAAVPPRARSGHHRGAPAAAAPAADRRPPARAAAARAAAPAPPAPRRRADSPRPSSGSIRWRIRARANRRIGVRGILDEGDAPPAEVAEHLRAAARRAADGRTARAGRESPQARAGRSRARSGTAPSRPGRRPGGRARSARAPRRPPAPPAPPSRARRAASCTTAPRSPPRDVDGEAHERQPQRRGARADQRQLLGRRRPQPVVDGRDLEGEPQPLARLPQRVQQRHRVGPARDGDDHPVAARERARARRWCAEPSTASGVYEDTWGRSVPTASAEQRRRPLALPRPAGARPPAAPRRRAAGGARPRGRRARPARRRALLRPARDRPRRGGGHPRRGHRRAAAGGARLRALGARPDQPGGAGRVAGGAGRGAVERIGHWMEGLDIELVGLILRRGARDLRSVAGGGPGRAGGDLLPDARPLLPAGRASRQSARRRRRQGRDPARALIRLVDALYRTDKDLARRLLVGARASSTRSSRRRPTAGARGAWPISASPTTTRRWRSTASSTRPACRSATAAARDARPSSTRSRAATARLLRVPTALVERLGDTDASPFARAAQKLAAGRRGRRAALRAGRAHQPRARRRPDRARRRRGGRRRCSSGWWPRWIWPSSASRTGTTSAARRRCAPSRSAGCSGWASASSARSSSWRSRCAATGRSARRGFNLAETDDATVLEAVTQLRPMFPRLLDDAARRPASGRSGASPTSRAPPPRSSRRPPPRRWCGVSA